MNDKETGKNSQAEKLKAILKGFGISTAADLDAALAEALGGLDIGIMTDIPAAVRNTA